jgi:hypothetical protein
MAVGERQYKHWKMANKSVMRSARPGFELTVTTIKQVTVRYDFLIHSCPASSFDEMLVQGIS